MLKLRLKRTGRKNDPSFRIVVTESTAPPKGKYLESVGSYKPSLKQLSLDKERVEYWLSKGVRPTDVVHNILVKAGILKDSKKAVHSTRIRKKKEGEESGGKEKASAPTENNVEGASGDVEVPEKSVEKETAETSDKTEAKPQGEEAESESETEAKTEAEPEPAKEAKKDKDTN